jgi:hypothetical protein
MKVHEAPTGFGFAFNTSPATLHAVSDAQCADKVMWANNICTPFKRFGRALQSQSILGSTHRQGSYARGSRDHLGEGVANRSQPYPRDRPQTQACMAGRGRTKEREVEERLESRGCGIRTSSPSHETRAEQCGMREMGTSSSLSASEAAAAGAEGRPGGEGHVEKQWEPCHH